MGYGQKIKEIQSKFKSGVKYQKKCEYINKPSAKEFYKYVVANKPVIITGVANTWSAVNKWTDEYLIQHLREKQVRKV